MDFESPISQSCTKVAANLSKLEADLRNGLEFLNNVDILSELIWVEKKEFLHFLFLI